MSAKQESKEGITAWLRSLDDARLADLIASRLPLYRPPTTFDDLGGRLSAPQSAWEALQRLDRGAVQVAGLLAHIGGRATTAELAAVLARSGPVPAGHVEAALERLETPGLCWPVGKGVWRCATGLRHYSQAVLGFGPPWRQVLEQTPLAVLRQGLTALSLGVARSTYEAANLLATEVETNVEQLLASAPEDTRAALELMACNADGVPLSTSGLDWLDERCLLLADGRGMATVPAELIAYQLGDRVVGWVAGEPIPLAPPVNEAPVHEAMLLVARVRSLLEKIEAAPLKALRSGGIGVQEQRRLAKALGQDQEAVCVLLELAGASGLLTTGFEAGTLTKQGQVWLDADEVEGYLAVVAGRLALPWLVAPDATPLSGYGYRPRQHPDLRDAVAVPPGDDAAGAAWLSWRWYAGNTHDVRVLLAELAELGLRHRGHPAPWAGPLLAGDLDAARGALEAALPTAQDDALFQADGTAVVRGRASSGLRQFLDRVGERESDRTWRLTPAAVRQALDDGATAEGLLLELRERSARDVPQVLEVLIADVAARHGRIQVIPASTLLRFDDPTLALEVIRDKKLATLGLTEVQPGVLASTKKAAEVLAALRASGHAPVGPKEKARPRPAAPAPVTSRPAYGVPTAAQVVLNLRKAVPAAGPQSSPVQGDVGWVMDAAVNLPRHEASLLAIALASGRPVEIDYEDAQGRITTRVVEQLVRVGALLEAWCRLRDDERTFAPEGILAVRNV